MQLTSTNRPFGLSIEFTLRSEAATIWYSDTEI